MCVYVTDACKGANGQFCVGVAACGTCLFLQHLSLPELSVTTHSGFKATSFIFKYY